jgi:hypothetical protein
MKMEDVVMKNRTKSAAWVVFMFCAVSALAQTKPVITIGGSVWNAKWDAEGKDYEGMKADAGIWVGPYLNIRIGKVLLGSSMYFGKIPIKGTTNMEYEYSIDCSRNDLNFSLGYSLIDNLNAFFAVKNASIKGENTFPPASLAYYDEFGNLNYNLIEIKREIENKGTLFGGGLSGTYRFPQSSIFLFGSFALLKGTMNFSTVLTSTGGSLDQAVDESVTLKSYNAGIGFQTGSGISILVGFRGENSSGEGGGEEKVNGIMATLAYTLR